MSKKVVFYVSDDADLVEKVKSYFSGFGITVTHYTNQQWKEGLDSPHFRHQIGGSSPSLVIGHNPVEYKSNVLQFPNMQNSADLKVSTMNEIEGKAIENAIVQYRGNLTEAAKALGIGRATLYRKVKQYNIDPNIARKKKAA